jgi:hypothetical protein
LDGFKWWGESTWSNVEQKSEAGSLLPASVLSKWPLSADVSHFQTHYEKYKVWNLESRKLCEEENSGSIIKY